MGSKITLFKAINYQRKLLIVWVVLLLAWLIMTFAPPLLGNKTGRLLADPYDRGEYFKRGGWFNNGSFPVSEYPQIPTLLFGLNHLTSNWADPNLRPTVYTGIFSLEMLLVLFMFFKVLVELLPPEYSKVAFLVLLPPTIYFVYNRFDILPAFLCLLAYRSATKRQWVSASFILAIATFTKWYPVLLFPGFIVYASTFETKFQWKMIVVFSITSGIIMGLTLIYGGLDSLIAPYQFHVARGMEFIALPMLLENLIHSFWGIQISSPYLFLFFFGLQISGPILVFFSKIETLQTLAYYCLIVTGIFVLFSRIWSPQWFLWLIPFLIISAKNMKSVGMIIAYNFITYLSFPVIYDSYGSSSYPLQIFGLLTYVILGTIVLRSLIKLKPGSIQISKMIAAQIEHSHRS